MADNVAYYGSVVETIAADEVNSVKYQRIKLALGADGFYDGDVSLQNPLPTRLDPIPRIRAALNNVTTNTVSNSFDGSRNNMTLQVIANGVGATNTVLQVSNDNQTWIDMLSISLNGAGSDGTTFNAPWRFMRVNASVPAGATLTCLVGD